MFAERIFRWFHHGLRFGADARAVRRRGNAEPSFCEPLETRVLLSESASAQLSLTSTTGTPASPVYHYSITVTDTGTTNIGTFWFSWVPGEDFLPSAPFTESSPTGWGSAVTGSDNHVDGSAIQWVASSNAITPGHSLSGFAFASPDSPTTLAGKSPDHPSSDVLTSFVYVGEPEADPGFQFTVASAVTTAASTTSVVANPSTINEGGSVTFTATVAPASGTGATPTGTVTFLENGTSIGTGTVQNNGTAALSTSMLSVGSLSITAQFGGDSTYSGSTSSAIIETVAAGSSPTTTALGSSAPSIQAGDSVTFTATVAAVTPGGAEPTGTVSFSQDGNSLGSMAVQGNGTAAISTTALPVGTDNITAIYSGDATYAGSTSSAVVETVAAPATLAPTIVKSTIAPSLVGGAAAHGAVKLSITNTTGAAIKGKITLQIFASTTGSIDGSAIQLANVVRPLNVKTTSPKMTNVPVKIVAGLLPAGSYMLFARVVDLTGNNNDSTTGPALTVAAPFIALSETFVKTTIPASAVAGAKAHAVAILRITNNGNITTPGTTTAALFASLSGVIDGSATQINSVTKPLRIHAGKSVTLSIPVKQIPAVVAGAYTIIAQVTDPNSQITTVTSGVVNITTA